MPDLAMQSRVHPKYKTKDRVGIGERTSEHSFSEATGPGGALPTPQTRGDLRRPGGQKRFSDLAIETAWTLRLVFSLPVRPTEGFLRSVLFLLDVHLDAPDHPPRSRRGVVATRTVGRKGVPTAGAESASA